MNLQAINDGTKDVVNQGIRVFQIHRFGSNEYEHVATLTIWADFPENAHVIDLGSGVGEVARIMRDLRKDLRFTLVNLSSEQLKFSPNGMGQILGSYLEVPKPDGSYDAAMFCFAIGHEDQNAALKEANRLIKKNGVLFIYDMVRVSGSNESMKDVEYTVLPKEHFLELAEKNGFQLDFYKEPYDNGEYGKSVLGSDYEKVFKGTIPAVWRFTKC
jgi:ubiquinone/menaquinone biosynthesis C-methylase UbiE